MRTLSIEIGEHFTRVGNIHSINGKYNLEESFVIKTPAETYDDGYINKSEELIDLLFASFHKYGIKNRKASFVITSSKIINREIVLPFVKGAKVAPLVMSNIGEYFPVDLSVYHISWKIMEKFTDDTQQKKMRLMVIAVPKSLIENYHELSKNLGVSLVSIDYAGNAIYQLVKYVDKTGAMFSLHIGDNSSIASVVNNGVLELQRTIPFGMDYIINSVAEYFPEARMNKLIIIEKLKANCWVNGMMEIDDDDDESGLTEDEIKKKRITESMKPFLDRVERLMHYYLSMKTDARLDKMLLTGTGSAIEGLPALLQFELGMIVGGIGDIKKMKNDNKNPKNPEDTVANVVDEKKESDNQLTALALCMGSMIDPMDLIAVINQGKKNVNVSTTPGIIAAVASGVLCAGMITFTQIQLNDAKDEQARLNSRIQELSYIEQVYTKHSDISQVLSDTKDMVNFSRTPNENLVAFINELEEKMPKGTDISNLSISTTGASMNVATNSWVDAADAISQLKTFDLIESISVSSVTENEETIEKTTYNYYADGVKVDSVAAALEENPDAVISIEEVPGGEAKITYTFSVAITWKDIIELEQEKAEVESADTESADTEEKTETTQEGENN